MKSKFATVTLALLGVLVLGSSTFAAPFLIDDQLKSTNAFWGGIYYNISTPPPEQYQDVIGNPDFAVDGMSVSFTGTVMNVTLTGDYFQKHGLAATFGPGDLYLSSQGWSATGTGPHYYEDNFLESEGWDYVVSLSDSKVYALAFSDITMTNAPASYGWRESQAWKRGYGEDQGISVTTTLTTSSLTFTFDTAALSLGSSFGLHWTMQCGNDVVEGMVPHPVPEPASLFLISSGLAGLGLFRRKCKQA